MHPRTHRLIGIYYLKLESHVDRLSVTFTACLLRRRCRCGRNDICQGCRVLWCSVGWVAPPVARARGVCGGEAIVTIACVLQMKCHDNVMMASFKCVRFSLSSTRSMYSVIQPPSNLKMKTERQLTCSNQLPTRRVERLGSSLVLDRQLIDAVWRAVTV